MSAGVVGTKVQQLVLVALLLVAAVAMGFFMAQRLVADSGAGAHTTATETETVAVANDGWEW